MFEGGGRGGEPSAAENFESAVERRAEVDPRASVEKTIRDMLKASHAENDFMNDEFKEKKDEIAGKMEIREVYDVLGELMTSFEERHSGTESNVDPFSPESKIEYLLSLLIECGGDWSSQKRQAVRRVAYNYVASSYHLFKTGRVGDEVKSVLLEGDWQKDVGELKPDEQKLIDSWLQK